MPVLAARLLQIRGRREDYLALALLISIAVHAALLAVHFHSPPVTLPRDITLEVTLMNVRSETPPDQPQALAQVQFDGGGTADTGMASTPLPLTANDVPDEWVLAELRKRQKELEAEQARLFALLEARAAAAQEAAAQGDDTGASQDTGEDDLEQDSLLINARIAALKDRIERYNARPRHHFVGPSTLASPQAAYLEAWREKIEALGTEHYPPEARGRIYGSLQLTVYIRRDGSLLRVEIDRPSEEPVLNQAALRIVQLAAPFAPLPPELAAETDILAITRTWHFTHEQLETHQP